MSPADVLAEAQAAGVELLVHNGKLASRGPAAPELRDAIRAHRHGLLALLEAIRSDGHRRGAWLARHRCIPAGAGLTA